MVLVGGNNNVNDKLVREISEVLPISWVGPDELLQGKNKSVLELSPAIFVNLMDVGSKEIILRDYLQKNYTESKLIGIHAFMCESMKYNTLELGYDGYISIFKLSDELYTLLKDLKITL